MFPLKISKERHTMCKTPSWDSGQTGFELTSAEGGLAHPFFLTHSSLFLPRSGLSLLISKGDGEALAIPYRRFPGTATGTEKPSDLQRTSKPSAERGAHWLCQDA